MKTKINHTSWKKITLAITASLMLSGIASAGVPSITISLPIDTLDTTVPISSVLLKPVSTTNIDAAAHYVGFQGDFSFDETVCTFPAPFVQTGGLTGGNWNVTGNVIPGPGPIRTLRVSAFSNDFVPLSGSGTLYQLRMVRVSNTPGQSTPLTWAPAPDNFFFIDDNLDTHTPTQTNGLITITGPTPTPGTPTPTATFTPTATATATATFTPTPTVTATATAGGTPCATVLNENFDSVTAPALPAGWVASNAAGGAPLWVTTTTTPDTAPNDAFIDDPAVVTDKRLDTPNIAISSASAQVTFRNFYFLESTFDGGVLEVSSPNINAGAFTDVTNAAVGGNFVSGGYNATISTSFQSPIAGRMAWSGNAGGYVTSLANLGPNVAGQTIKLRFRMASDNSVSATGWRVDTVRVTDGACSSATPTSTATATATATTTGTPPPSPSPTCSPLGQGFDDITVLPGLGWVQTNHSTVVGTTNWFQGNSTVFPSQSGPPTSYIGANFNNTTGTNTISNWLLTPPITLQNGNTATFWTRTVDAPAFPDRLQARMSTNGASSNVGTTATDVGDFTTLLLDINPTYTTTGYPNVWTQFTVTVTGVPSPTLGRLALRYFVENGGPTGANSDYIGIDTFLFNGACGPTPTPGTPTPTATATATTSGTPCASFNENFDGVTAPALPSGWVASNAAGGAPLWVTTTTTPDTAPNDAFIDDPAVVTDKRLDTPNIAIGAAAAQVTFRNFYFLESTFDGGVLEVSSPNINGGAFTDITNAAVGGNFVSGGYNATISTSFQSPIAGRMAWSGNAGGYVTSVANLGPNVAGQTIKLRFRMASDNSVSATGWRVDTVAVSGGPCGTPSPTPTATATSTGTPSPSATPSCPPVITQSSTQVITTGNSVSCNNGVGHTDNSYWRAFNMLSLVGGAAYNVTSVDFGVESANNTQPVTVRLYTNVGAPFPGGTRTQIATTTVSVTSAQTGTVVNAPLTAAVPAGTSELVMELFTPDGQAAGNLFFVGSNVDPESGPSYLSAAACGVVNPTTVAALGFPNMHIVFNVHGSCGGGSPTPTATATATGTPPPSPSPTCSPLSQGFDDITVLPGLGWVQTNHSTVVGTTNWFQGNSTVFPGQSGPPTSYIGANFNNTTGTNTISNWLLTPPITLQNGNTATFWTRTVDAPAFPDRLQARMSTNGASSNVGTTATDVGDFTTLLLDINPTYTTTGYPNVWTQFTVTVTGVPSPTLGRLALRYFVENGGPTGANSDYIGIDTFLFNGACGPTPTPGTPTPTATASGTPCASFNENFDGVTAPALPSGWVASNAAGGAPLWVTTTTTPDTAPNDAFIDDPAVVTDKRLDTPNIAIGAAAAQVTFRNFYFLESTFDGGVLEVSSPNINGGAFTDITNAAVGGNFVSGGYNATISTSFQSPIAGRMAWSGNAGGYVTSVANLGPNVAGQTIKLRFRMASDNSVSATGWRVDTVAVSGGPCGTPSPTPTATATSTGTPSPSATPSCPPVITQSSTQVITTGNSVSCNNGVGHTDNSYWRAFNMLSLVGGAGYNVTSVDFGVESANNTQPVTVRLYTNSGAPFPGGTRTQIATTTVSVTSAQTGTVVNAPLAAAVPAGTSELVMELFTPDGQAAGNLFFVGSNVDPESGPSYLSAAACGVVNPTTVAALGFPNMHIVFNVHGTCGGSPSPTATFTPTATATVTSTATATATPTATSTGTPVPTPSITPTPSVSPSASPSPGAAQALNLSTRMLVLTGDQVGIGGFIVTGSAPKQVLLRAIGPSLSKFGVPNPLADPVMELHGSSGLIMMNNNWRDTQEAEIIATGLPPTNDLESAILVTLDPGNYTAIVKGVSDGTGVALVEVYDLDQAAASKLGNISTRAYVSTGSDIMIAGFILGGDPTEASVILRGIGPSLGAFGVPNALADPTLELRDSNGGLLRANDNWMEDPEQAAIITAAGLALTDPLESGIAATLPPGQYTALLAGLNMGVGNGLVEAYDLGPGAPIATPTPGSPTPTATAGATATATATAGGTPAPTPTATATVGASPSPGPPCVENWDSVTAPALPPGWVASNPDPGDGTMWVTSTTTPDSAPNDAFVPDQDGISDKVLDRIGVTITGATAMMTFRNNFNTEFSDGIFWDGYVLEVSSPNISGGEFLDITDSHVGGSFVSGGYTGEIDGTANNPLAGRMAWSHDSGGYIDTVINLGPNLAGQTVVLRFRMGTDEAVAAPGVRIDNISLVGASCP